MAYTRILIEAGDIQTSRSEGQEVTLKDGSTPLAENVVAGDMICAGVGCGEVTKVTRFHYDDQNNLTETVLSEA